jgi:diguanylate cyclase (GGDEF)-like protein
LAAGSLPSLTRTTPMTRSARTRTYRFCSVIALAGVAVLVGVLIRGPGRVIDAQPLRLIVFGLCVLLGEMFPLQLPRGRGEETVTFSSTFSFGLLLVGGLWPAVVSQSLASALPDIRARRPPWRILFNVAQLVISLAGADLVLHLLGGEGIVASDRFTAGQLPAILLAAGMFWLLNIVLVGIAVALWQGAQLLHYFRQDLMFSLVTGMALLGLAPVVVRWSVFSLAAFPLFGLPLYAVYIGMRHAVSSEHQATHDALTGLPNRVLFHQAGVLASTDTRDDSYAILLLDLDRFKEINDTLGHACGDSLLVEIASRIRQVVRDQDTLARLGGDEFALLLTGCTEHETAREVANRVVEVLAEPIEIGAITIQADLSIGIAFSSREHRDVQEILRRADVAMYHAKEHHVGMHVFTSDDDHLHPDRLGLAGELRGGIRAGELVVHYQPKLDVDHDRVDSLEALVRWQHPRLGLLQPDAFIELAEHTGTIGSLTSGVIEQALTDCARWRAAGFELTVAVNVSMRSLREQSFCLEVAELIHRTGARAEWLVLEITESTIMADPDAVMTVLHSLEKMGVSLSIDDFGTGYCSLSYLRQLPVSELKIDRSFMVNLVDDRSDNSAVIVRSTVNLAHNLGLRVVAEGVENRATLDSLRRLGCDEIQGYYLCRPLPAQELTVWLAERPASLHPQLRVV